ncbi:MAG: M28 family metallopeptidase [Pseudomonadota bacterium]|nr:M28 family metallopeptidase [Pseudomonadota bacterium]
MKAIVAAGLLAALGVSACGAKLAEADNKVAPEASADRVEAHVRFLADDLLEGREAGKRGYDLAALYVAEQYRSLGLQPGGTDGSYLQPVPLLSYELDQSADNSLSVTDGGDLSFEEGSDYLLSASSQVETGSVEAPAVFVGYGFTAPDGSRDDLAGVDLEGKIAVMFRDSPKSLNTEERAHYTSTAYKRISDAGAVGVVVLYHPVAQERYSFERRAAMARMGRASMTWIDADGTPFTTAPNIQASAVMSMNGARKLLSAAGKDFDTLVSETETGVDPFELGLTLKIEATSKHRKLSSPNVAAVLPGTDETLSDEYVVLSAHLDHEGVKQNFNPEEDTLFNGAMDNATGTSALLEVARLMTANPPKRSIVFVAVTAEEKGLVGSDYYARFPTVPSQSVVANVNLDMPIMTYEFDDVVAFGTERSNLFAPVQQAVESAGLTLSPDPNPDLGLFTRSDHYSWVKQGIPPTYLLPGHSNGGKEAQAKFLAEDYHRPSDEADQLNYNALARFAAVKADIATSIANMDERPALNEGDFFGELFGNSAQ